MFKKKVGRPSNKYKRKVRNIKILGIASLISIMGVSVFILNNVRNNNIKANVNDTQNIAMFLKGTNVNEKMRKLSGTANTQYFEVEENIKNIKRSNTLFITPTEANIVSTEESKVPIYMWYDNGTIYWYCKNNIVYLNTDSSYMFRELQNLENIYDIKYFNTSKVTNMYGMFENCKSLKSLNISNFDTSRIESMGGMFRGCESITTLNLSKFNTSRVKSMSYMFAHCKSLKSINLNSFDTSNAENMIDMFRECESIISLDLSNFNTSNVTNMEFMFGGCKSLKSLNISNFNTSKVTKMSFMFAHCKSLKSINLNSFDTSNAENMIDMFRECESIISLDLSNFNTNKITNMSYMFANCKSLKSLNISNFDTSKVTDMNEMFANCGNLVRLDLSNFATANVTNMSGMFKNCQSLTSLDLSNFNTSKVTEMSYMFANCNKLKTLNLSSFDTSNVTIMQDMFKNCQSLTSLDLSNFNTSKVTNMSYMFENCKLLKSLNLSNFDISHNPSMDHMFNECDSLIELNFNSFDISNLTHEKINEVYPYYNYQTTKISINHGLTNMDKKVITMKRGGYLGLNLKIYPINKKDDYKQIVWTSSNPKVVKIIKKSDQGVQLYAKSKSSKTITIVAKYNYKKTYIKVKVKDKGINSPEGYDISSTNTSNNNQVNQTKQKTTIKNSTSKPTLVTTLKISGIDKKECKKHGVTFTIDSTKEGSNITKIFYSIDNKNTWNKSSACTINGKKATCKINKKYKSIFYKVETANNHYQVFGDYCTK